MAGEKTCPTCGAVGGLPRVYKVKPGDTLTKIAREHGLLTPDAQCGALFIARANSIPDPDRIMAGSVIVIPAAGEYAP